MKPSVVHLCAILGFLVMFGLAGSSWPYKLYVLYPMAALSFVAWLFLMREIIKRNKKTLDEMRKPSTKSKQSQ